jgi:hypothetical protein
MRSSFAFSHTSHTTFVSTSVWPYTLKRKLAKTITHERGVESSILASEFDGDVRCIPLRVAFRRWSVSTTHGIAELRWRGAIALNISPTKQLNYIAWIDEDTVSGQWYERELVRDCIANFQFSDSVIALILNCCNQDRVEEDVLDVIPGCIWDNIHRNMILNGLIVSHEVKTSMRVNMSNVPVYNVPGRKSGHSLRHEPCFANESILMTSTHMQEAYFVQYLNARPGLMQDLFSNRMSYNLGDCDIHVSIQLSGFAWKSPCESRRLGGLCV